MVGKRKSTGSSEGFSKNGSSQAVSHINSFDSSVLSAFDGNSSDFFATVSKVIDAHRLRIFNTNISSVSFELSAPQGVGVTSVSWGSIQKDFNEPSDSLKKKKRKSFSFEKIVALGLSTGDIAICSAAQGSIIKTLSGGHTAPVSDVCFFNNGEELLSAGQDGFIIRWDGRTGEQKHKFRADSKPIGKIKISHNEKLLLVAGHQIMLWEISTWTLQQKYTGHASPIMQIMFSPDDLSCASIAEQDRSVCIWNTGLNKTSTNIAVLSVESHPIQLDISHGGHVLVVTEDGVVCFWRKMVAEIFSADLLVSKKKAKFTSIRPDGTLKFLSTKVDLSEEINRIEPLSARIPVIAACFRDGKVLTTRGNFIRPIFELLPYLDDNELILENLSISRDPASNLGTNSIQIKNSKQQSSTQQALVLGQIDFALPDQTTNQLHSSKIFKQSTKLQSIEPSLEERIKSNTIELKKLSESQPFLASQQKSSNSVLLPELTSNRLPSSQRFKAPNASSLSVLLSQALQSGDKPLLEQALSVSDPNVIYTTVSRLQVEQVVPLLDVLVMRLQRMPNRARQIIEWVRAVLMIHTGFLVSSARSATSTMAGGVGELPKQLGTLYQTIESRIVVYQNLVKLAGRLDMVVHQIQARSIQAALEDEEEVVVFNEDDDNEDSDSDDSGSDDYDEEDEINENNTELENYEDEENDEADFEEKEESEED
ncbi:WD repeat-containing protein 43 [Nowakowskiella sp. JEL0078]|nr:WD repeat-containing protein 43 [Nowakowskiella sp. JEL0078]